MADLSELTQQAADHLAGRSVILRWQNPPTSSAAGEVIKTSSGDLVVYIGNLTDVNSRFRVLLHELAHCRHDFDWIPSSNDHRQPAASVKRTAAERASWRVHPRERRASDQAERWWQYAEKNAHRYWRAGRSALECKLLALLEMKL